MLTEVCDDFAIDAAQGQWVTTIYMLTMGVTVPVVTYLARRFSLKRSGVLGAGLLPGGFRGRSLRSGLRRAYCGSGAAGHRHGHYTAARAVGGYDAFSSGAHRARLWASAVSLWGSRPISGRLSAVRSPAAGDGAASRGSILAGPSRRAVGRQRGSGEEPRRPRYAPGVRLPVVRAVHAGLRPPSAGSCSNAAAMPLPAPSVWLPALLGAVFIAVFVRRQRVIAHPLICLDIFASRHYRPGYRGAELPVRVVHGHHPRSAAVHSKGPAI